MQLKLFKIAKDNNLNFSEFKLLIYIIIMSDNNLHACFAANKRISKDLGISKSYASTRIASLRTKGLIKVTNYPHGKVFPGEKVAAKLKGKKYIIWRLIRAQKVSKSLQVSTSLMVKGLSSVNDQGFTNDISPRLTTVKPTIPTKNYIKKNSTNHFEEAIPDYVLPHKYPSAKKISNNDLYGDMSSILDKMDWKNEENNQDKRGIV